MPREQSFAVTYRGRRPFFMIFKDIFDQYGARLGPYGWAVYSALHRFAGETGECFPSYRTIALRTGMTRRQVIKEVAKIEAFGLLEIERRFEQSNVYTLLEPGEYGSPPTSEYGSPGSEQDSPLKKNLLKKKSSRIVEEKKNYRPDEYSDIILG
jgi:hypothetical protein